MRHPARLTIARLSLLTVVLACAPLAGTGCSPQPAPAPPPVAQPQAAPAQLVIHAQQGQSKAQQDRDNVACQSMASAQAGSSFEWARIFGSCMGSRGYLVK